LIKTIVSTYFFLLKSSTFWLFLQVFIQVQPNSFISTFTSYFWWTSLHPTAILFLLFRPIHP